MTDFCNDFLSGVDAVGSVCGVSRLLVHSDLMSGQISSSEYTETKRSYHLFLLFSPASAGLKLSEGRRKLICWAVFLHNFVACC